MSNYKIEDIEGIGPALVEKFRSAGVKDTASLLAECNTPKKRKAMAEKTGIPEAQILKFTNMADLYRIKGVGSEFAQLLEAAGVDTVPELAKRKAENLAQTMSELNAKKKLTRIVPSSKQVAGWIEQAKSLARVISY